MNTKHKIESFSLTEILLVMIIAVIVISMAFSVLFLIQKQMITIRNNFNATTQLNELNQVLWLDFQNYQSISYNQNENVLTFKTFRDSVLYQIDEKHIIRGKDSFNFEVKTLNPLLKNKESFSQIDALSLELETTKLYNHIFIYKLNSANQFMTN